MNDASADREHGWRFLTNHAHVLACIARDPNVRVREIAQTVGITERHAAHIIGDLEQAGYLVRTRDGRRNQYEVRWNLPMRHPLHQHRTIADLLRFLERSDPAETAAS